MRTFDTSGGGATSREPAIPSKSQLRNAVPKTPRAPSDRSHGTLTKREIAQAVYSVCPGLSRSQAKGFVDAVIEEIVCALAVGEDVSLRGFGKFAVREKPERPGRNPKTGVSAPISARKVVTFKASDQLKAEVDGE
ncbi:HU family DNA-binding protein [Rhodoblastus sp.]|uniref:HU family DNA-binding protein n=1 Tax=Rhodoblastus sp. TaxID=1962975 RepID=UPI003F949B8D